MTPSRSRMTSFTEAPVRQPASTLLIVWRVRHEVHQAAEIAQQGKAVGAQLRLRGIDHHRVEESVDRLAQARKRLQRAGEVELLQAGLRPPGWHRAAPGAGRPRPARPAVPAAPAPRLAVRAGASDLRRMLAMRLLAAASASNSRKLPEFGERREALLDAVETLRVDRQHRLDVGSPDGRARAGSRAAGRRRSRAGRPRRCRSVRRSPNGLQACADQPAELQRQRLLDQHPDDAERMAPQRERILLAGRTLADAPDARKRLELVGEGEHAAGAARRQGRRRRSAAGSARRSPAPPPAVRRRAARSSGP